MTGEGSVEAATATGPGAVPPPSESKPVLRHSGLPLPGWVPRSAPAQPVLDALDATSGDTAASGSTVIAPPADSDAVALDPQSVGAVTVLPADALDALPSQPAEPGAAPTLHGGRPTMGERGTMALSAILGSVGVIGGLLLALVDAYKYDKPAACTAYATAHKGMTGFGCSATARTLAIGLPAIGLPVLVIAAFALIWVPSFRAGRRALLLAGLLVALLACGAIALGAYSSLPANS